LFNFKPEVDSVLVAELVRLKGAVNLSSQSQTQAPMSCTV